MEFTRSKIIERMSIHMEILEAFNNKPTNRDDNYIIRIGISNRDVEFFVSKESFRDFG